MTPERRNSKLGLEALTRWVLAHKRAVAAFWIVLTIAGLYGSTKVVDALDDQVSMPDGKAYLVNEEIEQRFGAAGGVPPLVAVATLPAGSEAGDPGVRKELRGLERRLGDALPGARIASYGSTGERAYVSDDRRTTFVVVHPKLEDDGGPGGDEVSTAAIDAARVAVRDAEVGGADVLLTGQAVLAEEAETDGGEPSFLSETLIAGVAALLVLIFVFASALAAVPLLMAIVAIPVSLLAVLGLTAIVDVNFIVVFLVSLIGLGIAIDYALIVVMRWREERERGLENEDAVMAAASTAGRAAVFSGTTVAIGLLAALVLPIPFLRSMAYGGLVIPLVSVVVALTLLPVVLATVGPRADRRRLRRTERADRHWASWARLVVRHRAVAVAGGAAVLIALCAVSAGMVLGTPEAGKLGGTGEPQRALEALERSGIGAGPLAPVEVITGAGEAETTAATLAEVDGVRAASVPGDGWSDGERAVIEVFTDPDPNSNAGRGVVDDVVSGADGIPATGAGGQTAVINEWVDSVYGLFPIMLGLISLITFILLARAFRSLVLPAKAIAMNLLSVFGTWGVMTLVWQHGLGTELLFGTEPVGAVTFWAPIIVFAFIYGLSMDYEVFILARMREEYDRTGSTDAAVVRGIGSTGRLVTSAALIVFLAFASMSTASEIDVKVLATGLAAGVLLDALVVRALLVPATVSWLGRWNWWMPEPARRALRLPESPPPRPALEPA
jgi:putative drug exporter of the RND superfamily